MTPERTPAAHLPPMTPSLTDPPVHEPMLIGSMRRRPAGEVRHEPLRGPKAGTSTRGFLAEFDEYVDARVAAATAAADARYVTLRDAVKAIADADTWGEEDPLKVRDRLRALTGPAGAGR